MLVGIVGKPNVGKSTFFKAVTLAEVEIANFPFTTIKPNQGVGFVKTNCVDKEFGLQCKPNYGFCLEHKRFIPIKLLDVAGLVPEAHKGKGLGNQFLDDLRQADVLIHIIDVSGTTDAEGKPTQGYDPSQDILFLEREIDMWLFGIIKKDWNTLTRKIASEKKNPIEQLALHLSGLKIKEEHIGQALEEIKKSPEDLFSFNEEQLFSFVRQIRKISKPMVIAANKIDKADGEKNLQNLKNKFPDYTIIPCSAEIELALREAAKHNLIKYIPGSDNFEILHKEKLSEKQKKALEFAQDFLKKWHTTGIQQCLNHAVFSLLNYIVVYPVENENKLTDSKGNYLPDAILLKKSSTVIDLAYAIHTDIGKNFVAAIDARTKKRIARDYVLKDRDIIKIIAK